MDRIETILRKGGDGSLYVEDRRTEVIEVTEFSKRDEEMPVRSIEIEHDESLKVCDYLCLIDIHLKGGVSSEGVIVRYRLIPEEPLNCRTHESMNCLAEWKCLTSIVDSKGCRDDRWQSVTLIDDGVERPEIKTEWMEVVSSDSLLRDAEVLLPNDKLTIQVEMVLKQYYAAECCNHEQLSFDELRNRSFEINSSNGVIRYRRVKLDSPLGELLREESRFFERLCATNMVEKNSGFLEIAEEEEKTFMAMVELLSYRHVEHEFFTYLGKTVKDILDIYRMSHYYGIESVLDTCRCCLRQIFRERSYCVTSGEVSECSELAEIYEDPIIRGIVEAFNRRENKTETQSGVEEEPWTLKLVMQWPNGEQSFCFEPPAKIKKEEHVTEVVSTMSHCYI